MDSLINGFVCPNCGPEKTDTRGFRESQANGKIEITISTECCKSEIVIEGDQAVVFQMKLIISVFNRNKKAKFEIVSEDPKGSELTED